MAGGVANGEFANEDTFNDAFMARNGDTDTTGIVDLLNDDPLSGSHINNLQKNLNALCSALGISVDQIKNYLITWDDATTSSVKDKVNTLLGTLQTKYTLANNQALTDVTGLLLNSTTHKSASFTIELERVGSSEFRQIIQVNAIFKGAAWALYFGSFAGDDIAQTSVTSTEQVALSITSGGQVQYATGNLAGHSASSLKVYSILMKV
jgi:hypothetical protein